MASGSDADRGVERSSSLEKGLLLLRELAAAESPLTLQELTHATGFNRTTTYRLCDALERIGWIQSVRDGGAPRTRRVDLGPQALGMAVLITSKYDDEARLQPIMDALARTVDETVHCGVLDDTILIHVGRSVPGAGLHMAMPLGARDEAHMTSLGKAILATLTRNEVLSRYRSEKLPVRTPHTLSTRTALLGDLDQVRKRGYAIDNEESTPGIKCVGAPVFDSTGLATFALSVTATPVHLEGERLDAVAAALRHAASEATAALGGFIPPDWGPASTPSASSPRSST